MESIRQQTIPCEMVVINDKEHYGAGWARNKGLRQVTTPFVSFLDADDINTPRFAELMLAAWRPNSYVWSHWYEKGKVCPLPEDESAHLVNCLMSTDLARLAGGFDEGIQAEDTDFYIRLRSMGVNAIRVAEPLVYYSTSKAGRQQKLKDSGQFLVTMDGLARKYGLAPLIPDGVDELGDALFGYQKPDKWTLPAIEKPISNGKKFTRPARSAQPDISIVAPTCDRLAYLQNMVKSARKHMPQNATYEIVIVDGGSKDGTIAWCKAQPDVWIIEHGELKGTVKAFTDGAKDARGRYVIVCNDDTEFMVGAIEKAKSWLDNRPSCGCVAFAYDLPVHPNKFIVGKHTFRRPNGQIVEQNFANMGMYRKWLGDQAGWCGADDPNFKARSYGSDSYISVRIWELGYSIDAVEGAIVHDRDAHDRLKKVNQWPPDLRNPDTRAFYERYPYGPDIPLKPLEHSNGVPR
jgi:glycosyltransferase involved in cell wall biosynthesis